MYQKAQRMTDIPKGLASLSNNADVQQAHRAGSLAKPELNIGDGILIYWSSRSNW